VGSARRYDRGKVMSYDMPKKAPNSAAISISRDGIPYRTLPGTHPTRGGLFYRARPRTNTPLHRRGGRISTTCNGLLRKFETARRLVPRPVKREAKEPTKFGAIYFGSTTPAMEEALDALETRGIHLDTLRIRAFRSTMRCLISSRP